MVKIVKKPVPGEVTEAPDASLAPEVVVPDKLTRGQRNALARIRNPNVGAAQREKGANSLVGVDAGDLAVARAFQLKHGKRVM